MYPTTKILSYVVRNVCRAPNVYCIAGNFGEVLIWRFEELGKDRQIKNLPSKLSACVPMMLSIQT